MEREPLEVTRRLMRAARSLNYNRELQPVIAGRIERAEGQLRGHLLARGIDTLRIGLFQIDIDEDGTINVECVPVDDNWKQMPLPRAGQEPQTTDDADLTLAIAHRQRENGDRQPAGQTTETIIYGRT